MVQKIWNGLCDIINQGLSLISSVLPLSPFRRYLDAIGEIEWLGYVNYFIPIGTFIAIFNAWLICMALYYLYSIIMRWIKIVGE